MRTLVATALAAMAMACGPAEGLDATSTRALVATDAGPTVCTPGNAQPDVCSLGQVCSPSGTCTALAAPSCDNFDKAKSSPADWYPTPNRGPVIYEVSQTTADPTWAGNDPAVPAALSVKVKAYWSGGQFPLTGQEFPLGLLYAVRDDGLVEDAAVLFRFDTGYFASPDRHSAEITINVMRMPEPGHSIGFAYANGNEACSAPMAP